MKIKIATIVLIAMTIISCNNGKKTSSDANSESTPKTSNASETYENPITEKYWKLKILEGKDIIMVDNQDKEIYVMLKTDQNKVIGFAGCNTIAGSYTLEEGNRIRFSNMLTTLKICPDVDVDESEFLKVFELVDNYTIVGDVLRLNVGKRASLAVFEAVYFQ